MVQAAPLPRPAGSSQVLRYRGTVTVGGNVTATYPIGNMEAPLDAPSPGSGLITACVRFALFNPNDIANYPASLVPGYQTALPLSDYDDNQPASAAPHTPVACTAVAGCVNATDLSLNKFTWAQNVAIRFNNIDPAHVFACDSAISQDGNIANGALAVVDGTNSGLGTNTGLPVMIVSFTTADNGDGGSAPFNIDIEFEIRHSRRR